MVLVLKATLGVPEDGVMTVELLQSLFMDEEDIETDKDEASTMKQEVKTETILTWRIRFL